MRRSARVDENQPAIVKALREMGATVEPLHAVGGGCPDLLCGYRGKNYLIEVKNPDKPKCDQRLTPDQHNWHAAWAGQVCIIKTPEDAQWFLLQHNGSN